MKAMMRITFSSSVTVQMLLMLLHELESYVGEDGVVTCSDHTLMIDTYVDTEDRDEARKVLDSFTVAARYIVMDVQVVYLID